LEYNSVAQMFDVLLTIDRSFKLLERGTIRDAKATDQLISRCPSLDHHNARAEEFYGALC